MDYFEFSKKFKGHSHDFIIFEIWKELQELKTDKTPDPENLIDKIYFLTRQNEELLQDNLRMKSQLKMAIQTLQDISNYKCLCSINEDIVPQYEASETLKKINDKGF